jgi:hypothetical protein
MSKFCGTCGSSLNEGQKFCGKCGSVSATSQLTPTQPDQQSYISPPAFAPVTQPQQVVASTPARSNSLLKVGVAAVVIIFVGGIAALGAAYYVVHKVKEKVQAAGASSRRRDSVLSGKWTCRPCAEGDGLSSFKRRRQQQLQRRSLSFS